MTHALHQPYRFNRSVRDSSSAPALRTRAGQARLDAFPLR
jgi:hypothetical protein